MARIAVGVGDRPQRIRDPFSEGAGDLAFPYEPPTVSNSKFK